MILSPSLLSADCGNLAETLKNLESAGVKWVHWDVMDGVVVLTITPFSTWPQIFKGSCSDFSSSPPM